MGTEFRIFRRGAWKPYLWFLIGNFNFSSLGGRRWYNRWRLGISRNHRSWWCSDIWPIVLFVIAMDMGNIKSELIFMVSICAIVKGLTLEDISRQKIKILIIVLIWTDRINPHHLFSNFKKFSKPKKIRDRKKFFEISENFCFLAEHILQTFTNRLQKKIRKSMEKFEIFNREKVLYI